MKIGVLIPVYNGGPYLSQAIESILAQDYGEFELLLIDDCSKDNSAEIIDHYAQRDPRVRPLYHKNNIGLAGTLNEGLNLCRAEVVARLDQDDEALPGRLRKQYKFLEENPSVLMVGGQARNMGATPQLDRAVSLPTAPQAIREQLPKHNCIYHPAVMYRRQSILRFGGYRAEFRNAEDYDLWLRLSRFGDLANLPDEVIRYRLTTSGMSYGNRWQQLRYVFLAQASHADPSKPISQLWESVDRKLSEFDRTYFFDCVARHGVLELLELGFPSDARKMFDGFASELSQNCKNELQSRLGNDETQAAYIQPSSATGRPLQRLSLRGLWEKLTRSL